MRDAQCIRAEVLRTRHPLRATRYWLACTALLDEAARLNRKMTVLDMGCGKGICRTFTGNHVDAQWIGLDWRADVDHLHKTGYDQAMACDFDKPLPLADGSVDAVICLHIMEHLPRPEFALSEIARVLRPGGLVVAATPVAPSWLAWLRQKQFHRQLRNGHKRPGQHIHAFCPARWRDMCRNAGLELEALTGGYLLRWAGNPLDNTRTWVRLNQVWGALFPSLGGEVLVKARLTSPVVAQTSGNSQRRSAASTGSLRWAGRAAAALAILLGAGLFLWWHEKPGCPVEALARSHQDGNNVFYAVAHPVLNEISDTSGVVIVQCATEFARLFSEYSDAGRDVHLFVTEEHMHTVAEPRQHLRIVGQTSLNGTSLYLLGREG